MIPALCLKFVSSGLGVTLALLSLTSVALCAAELSTGGPGLLVTQENAFCDFAQKNGIEAAFLHFLADSGVVLVPVPTNGKQVYGTPPEPGSSQRLIWAPEKAEIAAAGDFGYTTGPFWFYQTATDTTPLVSGHYTSVWAKQTDGSFKVIIDGGIPHAPIPRVVPVPRLVEASRAGLDSASGSTTRDQILKVLRDLDVSVSATPSDNTLSLAAEEIVVNRPGKLPVEGMTQAKELIAAEPRIFTRTPTGGDVASSLDLALTFGRTSLSNPTPSDTVQGGYLRVWKANGTGDWRIVVDVLLPPPRPRPAEPPSKN